MLTLHSGNASAVVAPEFGAGLIGWMAGGVPIFRRALPQAALRGDPHAMGCFPLLPYANRIAGARFAWNGGNHPLRRNFGDNPHTIHGLGWQRPWTIEAAAPASVRLGLVHAPDADWPFGFAAEIKYALSAHALCMTIRLSSRHSAPAPAGIGVHPFFPRTPNAAVRFAASGVWENDARCLPVRHEPVPPDWNYRAYLPVAGARLDNCFTGWDGMTEIQSGPASLRIEASPAFGHVQVFTPAWADFFCVEPVSHVPDAVNRADFPPAHAMRVLRPGESLDGTVRFVLTAAAAAPA